MYLCYDVKGIQRYIFAVPKLKYVIGASSIIDEFDRETAPRFAKKKNVSVLNTGGGRGTFCGEARQLEEVGTLLVNEAHRLGFDLRLGRDDHLIKASTDAVELWPVWLEEEELIGEPCSVSGMFPVAHGTGEGYKDDRKGIHHKIWSRVEAAKKDRIGVSLRASVAKFLKGPLRDRDWEFFKNLDVDEADSDEEAYAAEMAMDALDNMNNFAIVAMDGNDVGEQLRTGLKIYRGDVEAFEEWLGATSAALTQCTRESCAAALAKILDHWSMNRWIDDAGPIIAPVRPLMLGGDDILLLVHARYALVFAREMAREFQTRSAELHRLSEARKRPLWNATAGSLSISAGIAFVNIKFPLHAGIGIAEALLAQAKFRGRNEKKETNSVGATPAALDWEEITEGAIDTTSDRRQRTMYFLDDDDSSAKIRLTRRPYLMSEISRLATSLDFLADIPKGILHELFTGLRQAKCRRELFISKLERNHPRLAQRITDEFQSKDAERSTTILDGAMLLDMRTVLDLESEK